MRRYRKRLMSYLLRCRAGDVAPGGRSEENRAAGFRPAFLDRESGHAYVARFANGRLAPCHILDGMPAHLVVSRGEDGRVLAVKGSVIPGFLRDGRFYERGEAAAALKGAGPS